MVEDLFLETGACSVTVEAADDEACFDEADPGEPRWQVQVLTGLYPESEARAETVSLVSNQLAQIQLSDGLVECSVEDRDWESAWAENFRPFHAGNGLWISPTWCKPPEDARKIVWLDPGRAFGTGSHETTRLCLQWLAMSREQYDDVIDFGCGSGILGIAASKLGARCVMGVDIDPVAVAAANENGLANGVGDRF